MIFGLTLTGAADGTTDAVLLLSSFTLRLRVASQDSYLSCVVPNVFKHGDLITDRSKGDLVLTGDWVLITAALSDIRVIQGGSKSSINLTAYDAVTNAAPKTVLIEKIQYSNDDPAGGLRIRAALQNILPGDSVTYNGVTREVESVSISVSLGQSQMEISLI